MAIMLLPQLVAVPLRHNDLMPGRVRKKGNEFNAKAHELNLHYLKSQIENLMNHQGNASRINLELIDIEGVLTYDVDFSPFLDHLNMVRSHELYSIGCGIFVRLGVIYSSQALIGRV